MSIETNIPGGALLTPAADACCAPEVQETCCEPAQKADCCGTTGDGCGCQ